MPEYAHRALQQFMGMTNRFFHDGQYHNTSPSYMQQMAGTFSSWIHYAKGYTDSADYAGEDRLENLDLSQFSFVRRTRDALNRLRFPNGQLLPVNDTWGPTKANRDQLRPIDGPVRTILEITERRSKLRSRLPPR